MEQKNHESFSAAQTALSGVLKPYTKEIIQAKLGWAAAGLFLFVRVVLAHLRCGDDCHLWAGIWQVGVVWAASRWRRILWVVFHHSTVGKCLLTLVAVAALFITFSLGMPVLAAALNSGWWLPLILPLLAVPIVLSSFWWIAAPTPEGRKVLDHIAGFKRYLSITEAERLDRMTSPRDTPELFEKYLPFAIALGVENRWAKRFAGVLAAAQAQGQQGFAWYSGSSSPWNSPTSFVDNVGSSLSSAVGAASTAPGSSGGGSSGGGGGGGGGGGW